MRAFALSFAILFIFFIPVLASAGPLDGSIVPKCSGVGKISEACNFCDIFQLTQNLINFAVAFSVMVATVMFVYAGFLYFTASTNEKNIQKAHGIFWKVFLGFIFVLGAWLIVNVILSTLTGQGINSWVGGIECGASSSIQRSSPAPGGITATPSPTTGSGSTPQQIAFPAPVPTPPARPWCLEVDGETQCFATVSGCTLAYSVAERSGATVSECSSRSPEPEENASVPSEASLDEQTPGDEQTTQQGKQSVP